MYVSVCYNDFSKMGKDFHKLFSLGASPIHEVDAWSVVKRSEYLPYSHSSFFNKRRRERRREEEVREIFQDPLCCAPRHNHKWLNRLDAWLANKRSGFESRTMKDLLPLLNSDDKCVSLQSDYRNSKIFQSGRNRMTFFSSFRTVLIFRKKE